MTLQKATYLFNLSRFIFLHAPCSSRSSVYRSVSGEEKLSQELQIIYCTSVIERHLHSGSRPAKTGMLFRGADHPSVQAAGRLLLRIFFDKTLACSATHAMVFSTFIVVETWSTPQKIGPHLFQHQL